MLLFNSTSRCAVSVKDVLPPEALTMSALTLISPAPAPPAPV